MRVTVETTMRSNFPDDEAMRRYGGLEVLREGCAMKLVAEGCSPPYAYEDARQVPGGWALRASGEKEEA